MAKYRWILVLEVEGDSLEEAEEAVGDRVYGFMRDALERLVNPFDYGALEEIEEGG